MVCGEQDDCILKLPHLIKLANQLSNSIIDLCAHRKINCPFTPDCFRTVWWLIDHLIPHQHVTIIERMHCLVIWWFVDVLEARKNLLWNMSGIMWRICGNIHQKGSFLVPRCVEKVLCCIVENIGAPTGCFVFRYFARSGNPQATGIHHANFNGIVFGSATVPVVEWQHPTGDCFGMIKGAEQGGVAIVPFACAESLPALFTKLFREQLVSGIQVCWSGIIELVRGH